MKRCTKMEKISYIAWTININGETWGNSFKGMTVPTSEVGKVGDLIGLNIKKSLEEIVIRPKTDQNRKK